MVRGVSYRFAKKFLMLFLSICFWVLPRMAFSQSGYTFDFEFLMEDAGGKVLYDGNGRVLVSGGCFRVEIPKEFLVVCDGASQWIYNFSNDDVVVTHSEVSEVLESLESSGALAPVLENLVYLFTGDSKSYKASVRKDSKGNPVEIVIRSADEKDLFKAQIGSIRQVDNCGKENFIFDLQKYPTAVVTDLR